MYEQHCAFGGEKKLSRNIFMLLLLGFPPEKTTDIKVVGTDDKDLRGPVFLAVLLCKRHLETGSIAVDVFT